MTAPDDVDDPAEQEAPPVVATEPEDYSGETPIADDRYADYAAADWWAWRTGR